MKILSRNNVFPGKKKFGDRPSERLTLPLGSEGRTKGREVLRQEGKKATCHYFPGALSALLSEKQKFASATATAASVASVPTTIDLFALSRAGPSQGIMRDVEIYLDPQISSGHDPCELLYRGSLKFFGAYFKEVSAERVGGGERGREREREERLGRPSTSPSSGRYFAIKYSMNSESALCRNTVTASRKEIFRCIKFLSKTFVHTTIKYPGKRSSLCLLPPQAYIYLFIQMHAR